MNKITDRQKRIYDIFFEEVVDYVETYGNGRVTFEPGYEAHCRATVFAKAVDRVLKEEFDTDQGRPRCPVCDSESGEVSWQTANNQHVCVSDCPIVSWIPQDDPEATDG